MIAIEIPCPSGLSFFSYQREGIQFALVRPGTLLGDEMGTGKTVQVCGLINALGGQLRRILIVCPATMRLVSFPVTARLALIIFRLVLVISLSG